MTPARAGERRPRSPVVAAACWCRSATPSPRACSYSGSRSRGKRARTYSTRCQVCSPRAGPVYAMTEPRVCVDHCRGVHVDMQSSNWPSRAGLACRPRHRRGRVAGRRGMVGMAMRDGAPRLPDGTLAGRAMTMDGALRRGRRRWAGAAVNAAAPNGSPHRRDRSWEHRHRHARRHRGRDQRPARRKDLGGGQPTLCAAATVLRSMR